MNLVILKLISSEQVIGDCVGSNGTYLLLKNPRLILPINPQQSILAPFMLVTDEVIEIDAHHIMSRGYTIADQLRDAYEQQVTGLSLPPTPKIQLVKN